jgi:hypothetical protein
MPKKPPRKKKLKKRKSGKKKYKVRNWREYNEALKQRGAALAVWLSDDAIEGWIHRGPQQQGHPLVFSDAAIQTFLTVRAVFHMAMRQTEGFLSSTFSRLQIALPVPDYSTVSKRMADIPVDLPIRGTAPGESMHIVIDSTGLKVYGEGEWKVKIHGKSKRRAWRKLHLAVNPETGEVEAEELTEAYADDAAQVQGLLAQIDQEIDCAACDGAYDEHKIHALLQERGAQGLIPTSRDARIKKRGNATGPPLPRDEILRAIRALGRPGWKKQSGYHMRSHAENAMYRQKTIFGSGLRSRRFENQKTEARIRCRAMNIMTHLGMPESVVAA